MYYYAFLAVYRLKEYLTSKCIPNGVTFIGDRAFIRSGLTDMYNFAEQLPEIGSSIFHETYRKATLHVSASSVDAYSNAEQWKEIRNILALTDCNPPNRNHFSNS